MLTIYFSGTGNSRYIAEQFSKRMKWACFSIEEKADFDRLIKDADTIAFCYPIYGSDVPLIMQNFLHEHASLLENKKLIIFCTQLLFSGDGARVMTDYLLGVPHQVIYAEHFNMPNNICNFFLFRVPTQKRIEGYVRRADRKLLRVCNEINQGRIRLRGFNPISKYTGLLTQRKGFQKMLIHIKTDVLVDEDCISCGKCVQLCPMKNLILENKVIVQQNNCTACFRCVNECPKQAITVFIHRKVKKQYHGIFIKF